MKKKGNHNDSFFVHLINLKLPVMQSLTTNLILFLLLLSGTSASTPSFDFKTGRHNNVCKDLKNDVLLYFVFVDTRTTSPWSEFDILTTIDSIQVAARWLESQAQRNNITLNVKTDYYIGDEFATIQRNLPRRSVKETLKDQN